jgi:tRNA A22 N-methylase
MEKKNICKLCGWEGRTEIHHIISRKNNGSENDLNLIELCPNHHSEAIDEKDFRNKWNLIGEEKSEEELIALQNWAFMLLNYSRGEIIDLEYFYKLKEKYSFCKLDALAYFLGTTKNYVMNTYN